MFHFAQQGGKGRERADIPCRPAERRPSKSWQGGATPLSSLSRAWKVGEAERERSAARPGGHEKPTNAAGGRWLGSQAGEDDSATSQTGSLFFSPRERARQSGWWRRWRGRGGGESVRGRGGGESVDAEAAAGVPAVVLRRPDLHRQVAGCLTNRKSERSIPRDSGVRGSFPHEASDLPNAHMTHIQAGGCTEGVLQPPQHQIFGLQRSSAK